MERGELNPVLGQSAHREPGTVLAPPGQGTKQSQGVQPLRTRDFCDGEVIHEAATGGFQGLMRGRWPWRGEGWCPPECEGSGQGWTRSFLDEV